MSLLNYRLLLYIWFTIQFFFSYENLPIFHQLLFTFLFFLLVKSGYAQETEEKIYHQEIRLDLFSTHFFTRNRSLIWSFHWPPIELGYCLFVNFYNRGKASLRIEYFEIASFYRLYFEKKPKLIKVFLHNPSLVLLIEEITKPLTIHFINLPNQLILALQLKLFWGESG